VATEKLAEWWHEFYEDFRPLFGILPNRSASTLVRRIIKELNLRKGSTFLDCPCGYGRISIPLARKGIRVTGVDIMPAYLDELQQRAARAKVKIPTVHSDMRRINFENRFDAAGNLWTSFGYFEKESDNLLVLKKYCKALKPGGRFFMTIINRDWVMANFSSSDYMETGKLKVIETRQFDYER
jgi:2-polyprenyl-3-methyl-5-hydroxy-6-metoxy-1,4-benzoquinol methylase